VRLGRSTRDLLLTVGGALFSLLGLALYLVKRDPIGLATLAFFGGCAAVGIWSLWRGRLLARHAASPVELPDGARLQRSRFDGWAAGCAIIGAVIALTASGIGLPMVIIGAAMAALGVVLLLLLATGVLARPSLRIEREGLRFTGRRYSFLLEWENVASLTPGELHGHDLLLVGVRDLQRLTATVRPASEAGRLAEHVRSNLAWSEAELVVMAGAYGTDVAVLTRAMKRHLRVGDSS
jgi:hypothetical protein